MLNIEVPASTIAGEFKLVLKDSQGNVKLDLPWQKNLITKEGLIFFTETPGGTNSQGRDIYLGFGMCTTTPSIDDTVEDLMTNWDPTLNTSSLFSQQPGPINQIESSSPYRLSSSPHLDVPNRKLINRLGYFTTSGRSDRIRTNGGAKVVNSLGLMSVVGSTSLSVRLLTRTYIRDHDGNVITFTMDDDDRVSIDYRIYNYTSIDQYVTRVVSLPYDKFTNRDYVLTTDTIENILLTKGLPIINNDYNFSTNSTESKAGYGYFASRSIIEIPNGTATHYNSISVSPMPVTRNGTDVGWIDPITRYQDYTLVMPRGWCNNFVNQTDSKWWFSPIFKWGPNFEVLRTSSSPASGIVFNFSRDGTPTEGLTWHPNYEFSIKFRNTTKLANWDL